MKLWEDLGETSNVWTKEPYPTLPDTILDYMLPDHDSQHRPIIDCVTFWDTATFINSMKDIHFPAVDAEIWRCFQNHNAMRADFWTARNEVAGACIRHLAAREHDAELLSFCRRRFDEIKPDERKDLLALLKLLQN